MTSLRMLSADEALAEIRRIYFRTSKASIAADLTRAIALLTSMSSEQERERATVYMEGLTEMRSEWAKAEKRSRHGKTKPWRRVRKK